MWNNYVSLLGNWLREVNLLNNLETTTERKLEKKPVAMYDNKKNLIRFS